MIEVKNEARYTKLPKKDSGQLHDSLQWFAESYPTRTATPIVVSRATEVEHDAHFPDGTRVLKPEGLTRLLANLEGFVTELVTKPAAQWTPNEVGQLLARHQLAAAHIASAYTRPVD